MKVVVTRSPFEVSRSDVDIFEALKAEIIIIQSVGLY